MDVILSVPIISYFGGPMLSSWSGSMNLLFFYMTWTTLVLSHPAWKIELVGTVAVRIVFWLAPSLAFLLFDTLIPSLAEPIKLYGSASLPRRNAASLLRQLLLAIFNLALTTAVQAGISFGATTVLRHPLFRASTRLPLPWQILKHILMLYTAREVLTYYIHRYVLHSRGIFARLHSAYAHAHKRASPYALMVYTDHPLPLLLSRTLPVYLPAVAIQPHLLTYFLFTILTTLEEMLSMSSYSIVPGIVMGGITRRTAAHYASGGRGNYGAWGLLDWISGTNVGKNAVEDAQEEAERREPAERTRQASSTGSIVQDALDGLKKGRKSRKRSSD
ncbi:hypothetical protein GGS23DRAFT_20242 [Durotheca rogersii]|uniref:uncharacterized protein n=1 Tax=Durotheca rogersii TaxID=419775 RepID=UPI002220087E|nr:uncharacterized protein GGS23DRAFT_20242 [Durotheca rogersii]KAI5868274.1 hypothetical protein GGS23DRAFT_20242 [Durotheca rogersii]